ncbi:MAG: endonuclease/exonuclease/phosphatase family protein [Pseudonocardia sp.]|nr:endonuclease/exonuclease/phosphatase family protein [Pseudonocardia sp.]
MTVRRFGAAALLGAAAAAVVLPDRLRVDHRFPFVDVVAFRPHTVAGATALAGLLSAFRPARPAAAALGLVAGTGAAALVPRIRTRPAAPGPAALTILSANVLGGRADTGELAALIARERPDLVALPEAGVDFRDKLMPLLEGLGYRSWVSTGPGVRDIHGVALLASERAGGLRVRSGPEMRAPHLEATGGILGARTFYAVHTAAPMNPRRAARWAGDLAHVARWTRQPVPPIVAGDFNATLDHSHMRAALGGCRSAVLGTGKGLVGTFHSAVPAWVGIQIDHVLVPEATGTTRFEVLDLSGTDHRALLVELSPGSPRSARPARTRSVRRGSRRGPRAPR